MQHSPEVLSESHSDYELLNEIAQRLYRHAGGEEKFRLEIPVLFRRAIDEVIDAARSKRFTLNEIEKTEKTYLGTKIEILLRSHLQLEWGKSLDLDVDGIEVDVKNSISGNWTIPPEAMGHPCLLIHCNESKALCSVGLIVIKREYLNLGTNRDGKTTIKKSAADNIYWILKDTVYPSNFFENIDSELRKKILSPTGGTQRLAVLFRNVQRQPISRVLIVAIASVKKQNDALKRIRRNGGARDILAPEGIAILWGRKDRSLIQKLGLPACNPEEFISIKPSDPEQIALLRKAKHID